jgi:hypothetical protein
MTRIKLSARDLDMSDKYEPEEFNAEYKTEFKNQFNANNLAREMYDLGYHSVSEISQAFKDRNYEVSEDIKKTIKLVVEKMESRKEIGISKKE